MKWITHPRDDDLSILRGQTGRSAFSPHLGKYRCRVTVAVKDDLFAVHEELMLQRGNQDNDHSGDNRQQDPQPGVVAEPLL